MDGRGLAHFSLVAEPADDMAVPKSIYVIAAMGFAAVLVLGWMMQSLVKVQQQAKPSHDPIRNEINLLIEKELTTAPVVEEQVVDGKRIVVIKLDAKEGKPKPRLARIAGQAAWRTLAGSEKQPDLVRVQFPGTGGAPENFDTQPPKSTQPAQPQQGPGATPPTEVIPP